MKVKANLGAFTEHGQQIFDKYLEELENNSNLQPPFEILKDPITDTYNLNITKLTDDKRERIVELREFENKYEFAKYIKPIVSDLAGIEKNGAFLELVDSFLF